VDSNKVFSLHILNKYLEINIKTINISHCPEDGISNNSLHIFSAITYIKYVKYIRDRNFFLLFTISLDKSYIRQIRQYSVKTRMKRTFINLCPLSSCSFRGTSFLIGKAGHSEDQRISSMLNKLIVTRSQKLSLLLYAVCIFHY